MFQGTNDDLSVPSDFYRTFSEFPEGYLVWINVTDYNHLDYLWADNAYDKVYAQLIEFINSPTMIE